MKIKADLAQKIHIMPNWKTYRIVKIETEGSTRPILFHLDNHISYQNGGYKFIYCHNCLPFTAYKVGDYIEIDLEIMANNKFKHVFNENKNVIQGISCEANQPPHNLPTLFVEENFSQALTIG
ncbi:10039_t:CDS:2 [Entrophospora sp. SA101]|nr:9547_t:CDS:2 [Entrophospora sp. SA101]CAJ0628706.1 14933_t:CDS:2 [Entrophospora sp. SA101]CAJ0633725.1 13744_t:CDS:2 [Entrophospora sp. SA101]CAJ0755187.1 24527_t:CDS:2 [Entrophospora sp. SA101]CAJ0762464.1 6778_t:CDS:2 [Entrophospora sp. SA101]